MNVIKLFAVLAVLSFTHPVFAEGWYAGVGLGLADPSSEVDGSSYSYNSNFSLLLHGGYVIGEQISLGINSYTYSQVNGVGTIRLTPVVLEAAYHFEVFSGGPYAGAQLGRVREAVDVNNVEVASEMESAFGLMAGWNFDQAGTSFGVEASYLSVSGNPKSYSIMAVHGTWTYWF